jgi:hypothetical protein
MPDFDARHVGDRIACAGRARERDAEVARARRGVRWSIRQVGAGTGASEKNAEDPGRHGASPP